MHKPSLRRALVAVGAIATIALTAACGSSASTSSATTAASESLPAGVSISDAWVKATDTSMTAAFGMLHNNSDKEVTVVSATTPSAPKVELHEVVTVNGQSQMQPKAGGFPIPAGGELELKPGGYHIMLMDLTKPIESGTSVDVTLTLSDGTTYSFSAPVKPFSGGNETYVPGGTMSGM